MFNVELFLVETFMYFARYSCHIARNCVSHSPLNCLSPGEIHPRPSRKSPSDARAEGAYNQIFALVITRPAHAPGCVIVSYKRYIKLMERERGFIDFLCVKNICNVYFLNFIIFLKHEMCIEVFHTRKM